MKDKVFEAQISYSDKLGAHSFSYRQDIERWSHMAHGGVDVQGRIAEHLKDLGTTLERWGRSPVLQVITLTRRQMQREQRETMARAEAWSKKHQKGPSG